MARALWSRPARRRARGRAAPRHREPEAGRAPPPLPLLNDRLERLDWTFVQPHHIGALQNFTCTDPFSHRDFRGQRVWARWWERDAEQILRGFRPRVGDRYGRIGVVEGQGFIASASVWKELENGSLIELEAMGVARVERRQGGVIARAMFEDTLDLIEAQAVIQGHDSVVVAGYVWQDNDASRALCRDAGLVQVGEREGVQTWAIELSGLRGEAT